MAQSSSSSVQQARQVLADRLREIVRDAGLDGKGLAALCGWHPSKVSRICTGKTQPSEEDIRTWCRACNAEGQTSDLVASLRAVEGMWLSWSRMERTGLRRVQDSRVPLYERTHRFRSYSPGLFPGLLQTLGYTEDVLRAVQRRRVEVDDVADAVASRMERQKVLRDGHRTFAFIVEECVLRNALGGIENQIEQLDHLLTLISAPNISIGIIPARLHRVRMPVEGFWIFDSGQVNVELVSGFLTLTQPSEIKTYADTFAALSGLSVHGTQARSLIVSARDSLR
ncbi:helix-turn-helix transcriptional regulator [Streptomyces sp. NPDC004959]|uniref:helix-turn-helix domain-containing protein n=1 Tax=Streptomyces sp. NPDC004959 TaxID=3154673 RepID=UPI0033A2CF16